MKTTKTQAWKRAKAIMNVGEHEKFQYKLQLKKVFDKQEFINNILHQVEGEELFALAALPVRNEAGEKVCGTFHVKPSAVCDYLIRKYVGDFKVHVFDEVRHFLVYSKKTNSVYFLDTQQKKVGKFLTPILRLKSKTGEGEVEFKIHGRIPGTIKVPGDFMPQTDLKKVNQ